MQIDEKIKVFISSKCGGERINYDRLVDTDSIDKKYVADRAVRTNYDLVRRALKTALEETGLIRTYVFEDTSASSSVVKEDFLFELDGSDVCLFLIDNFDDNISEGLLVEITRAQRTNKKSFYLFLNHPEKEETSIQENIRRTAGTHYFVIDDIRRFIDEGYKSVINDILTTYKKYCKGNITFTEQEIATSVDIVGENFPVDTTDIDKQIFKNLGLTKNKMVSLIYKQNSKDVQTSDFDTACLEVLDFLLGEKDFGDIGISSLLEELSNIQPPEVHKLVCKRWEAISSFYAGHIEKAVELLERTYQEFSEDKSISKWLLNDILIDWRNLSTIKGQAENIIDFSVQKKIDQEKSLVFFPILDRFSTNINNALWDRNFSLLTSSPYSISLSNPEHLFSLISNYIFTAIYYGSFAQLGCVLEQIKKVIFDLVQKDNNILFKIQLMRISILCGNEMDFRKIFQKYGSSLSYSSVEEISELYNLANTKPLPYQKETWKVLIFSEIGYYLSDADFEKVSNEIFDLCSKWVESENPNVWLGEKLIKALKTNNTRLSQGKIIYFANKVFTNKAIRFYLSLSELLISLDFSMVSHGIVNDLILQIKTIINDEEINHQGKKFEHLLTKLRKIRDDFDNEIDEIVKEKFPGFFDNDYHLEISPDKASHIRRYLKQIESRNASQGVNGQIAFYANNPYITLRNILEYDQNVLDEKLLTDILAVLENTLLSKTQTYSAKDDAIKLIIFLKSWEFSPAHDWSGLYSTLHKNIETLAKGSSNYFSETSSSQILNLHLVLLKRVFGEDCLQELIETLALINNGDEFEKIESLNALENFLKFEKDIFSELSIASILIQYVSNFCFYADFDIRYRTVQVLYELLDTPYSSLIISQLSKMMDDDDYRVKWGILRQVQKIREYSETTFNYILGKAKIDKNYLVRKALNKYAI